jgi:hypothetical protein
MMVKFLTAAEARQRTAEFHQVEQAFIVINQSIDKGEYWTTLYKMPAALKDRLTKDGYKIREERYAPQVIASFGFEDDKEPDLQTRWIVSW